jgi:outer membrane protein OmpA-like peptidoglycan-associated protein/tetratricopeptide (TPR) repeat protein
MFRKIAIIIVLFFSAIAGMQALAQNECTFEPSAKAQKLLDKAADKKKYNSEERAAFYEEILEIEDNCHLCHFELGSSAFKRAKHSGGGFNQAQFHLEKLSEKCEEYHASQWYYLGAIHYAEQRYPEALAAFEKFLKFPDDDASKFDRDYDKKCEEVRDAIPFISFHRDFNKNIDLIKIKVVEGVSSSADDYLPALSPDGELMFFTRRMEKKAKGDLVTRLVEEFTWSKRGDLNATFDGGDALPPPFNQGDSYGGASISVDNKELFIARRNPVAGNPENIDLFVTRYTYGFDDAQGKNAYTWAELENLGASINTDMGWESQPSLSGDGKTLYFATVRENSAPDANGNPSSDIFYSERQADGSWSEAKSIGAPVNTSANEKAPYMHSDSKTLYFSSDRQPGGGGFDIWYTRQLEDGSWTAPKNIGAPVNTPEDEHGMIVSADGEEAFFASKRRDGVRGLDIYAFNLPEEARPERVVILKGRVNDSSGAVPSDAKVEIKYVQSKAIEEVAVSADDGVYAAVVHVARGEDVVVAVSGEGTAFNSHLVVDKEDKVQPAVVAIDVKVERAEQAKSFVIADITYATNSSDISRTSKLILDEFAAYLLANPKITVEIGGHTDSQGSAQSNLALSMDRAFEVKGHLEKQGVSGARITAKGYGHAMPVADNSTAEGRAKNRRTEFTIVKI